jgi:hypothetical protein
MELKATLTMKTSRLAMNAAVEAIASTTPGRWLVIAIASTLDADYGKHKLE